MRTFVVLALVLATAAAAPTWKMKQQNFAGISASVDCDHPTNCMSPVVNDDTGTEVLFSQDGGNTWTAVPETVEMMLLAGAISGNTAACASPFNMIAGANPGTGWNFTLDPKGYPWVQSQNVEPFAKTWFGAVGGAELSKNQDSWGTAISSDSGVTWWFSNASDVITCWTRYGAYPSTTTWYMSAGNWPETDAERTARMSPDASHYALSQRIRLHKSRARAEFAFASERSAEVRAQSSPYLAQLLKTTDGGKTWVSQFESSDSFYFNQIGCGTTSHCCAVGEADTDSRTPGVQIYCTWDGGNTWTRTYYGNDPTFSGLSLQFLTDDHLFVGGASLRQTLIMGIFWESLDGGKTWNATFVQDAYPAEMTFGSETMGLATGFDIEGVSCLLAYN